MTGPRVLLMSLSVRTSAKGREYLSGYLGKARVVGFEGEPDKYGNSTWNIFVAEPEPRDGSQPARRPQEHDGATARPTASPGAGTRPASSYHRAPRESATARQERLAQETAERHGVHSDADLNDALPF